MNKYLKWTLISIGSVIVLLVAWVLIFGKSYTKSFSPQEVATYEQGGTKITVAYSRPFKKDRVVFGGLVPYGEVWRTGANEATVFSTNVPLTIDGESLPPGDYTLFTIPDVDTWQVIFNSKAYSWGLNFDGTSPREAEFDVLTTTVPVRSLAEVTEQFTIAISNEGGLNLAWDQTAVSVPLGGL